MSSLNTNYINNTTRTAASNSEKNLQLGSDGSVTSFEGLSISDAAASNGLNYYRTWDGINLNEVFPYDRSKYNTFRVKGWFDLPGEPSNSAAYGFYIQPCIDGVPYTLSQLNGGFSNTFIQTTFNTAVAQIGLNQMIYNTSTSTIRWVIDHQFILHRSTAWSMPNVSSYINSSGTVQGIIRQLPPTSWDTTNGNDVNGFKILTNNVTNVATISQGQVAISISRNSGYPPF